MANWASIGHGMRRRMGAPSNHHESAGHEMAERKHITSDEALAQAGNSARVPMGAAPALQGTLIPKHNTQAGDPTNPGSKQNRVNIERVGATYRVNANMGATIDPAAGATMASARIVPSIQGRQNPNFESGIQSTY